MRILNLTEEEKQIYFDARLDIMKKKSLIDKMSKKYKIIGDGRIKYVVTHVYETKSREQDYESPNFNGTGMALAGVLRNGETIEDFIIHKESMKPVIEHRYRYYSRRYKTMWAKNKRSQQQKTTKNNQS